MLILTILNCLEMKDIMILDLRRKTVRDVILLFLTKKKLTNKEISEELKISPSNVGWHIKRMKLNNLINEKDPDWTDKNSIQARWLINKLNNSDAKFKVIYFHILLMV